MGNRPLDPREVAQMIVGRCLKKALEAARDEANGRPVNEVLVTEPIYHGTFLSRHDLENLAFWLDVSLYGKDSQLDKVFQFVQDALGDDEFGSYLMQEAPEITIALDRRSPRITFVTAA